MNITHQQNNPVDLPPAFPPRSGTNSVRAIGWVLIVAGPCLSVAMLIAAGTLADTIHHYLRPVSHTHWNGGSEFTRLVYGLYGVVFLLGIAIFAGGIYQARTGRRHPVIVGIGLVLAAVTACLVYGVISAPSTSL